MIRHLASEAHKNSVAHGFYEGKDPNDPVWIGCRLMLIVSELAEGLESVRDGNLSCDPKSGGLGEELADACIRIFDLAGSLQMDLEGAIDAKMRYNALRPYKHGGRAL